MSTTTGSQVTHHVGPLHPKRLSKTIAAISALSGALSVPMGVLAAHAAPHGLRGIAVSLHLARQPLIVKIAGAVASFAILAAAVSGLLHFYTWWQERDLD